MFTLGIATVGAAEEDEAQKLVEEAAKADEEAAKEAEEAAKEAEVGE